MHRDYKKIIGIIIIIILITLNINCFYSSPQNFQIYLWIGNPIMQVNGINMEIDPGRGTAPVIIDDRTLMPVRAIIEALGGDISWNGEKKRVSILVNGKEITLIIGSKEIQVGDAIVISDVAPIILNSRTFLPLRLIAENINCQVAWEGKTRMVTILYNANPSPTIMPTTSITQTPTPPNSNTVSEREQQMLDFVNAARAEQGIAPLKFDMELLEVARTKAKDMADNDYFSHTSPTYGSPFDMINDFGIEYSYAGENIAKHRSVQNAFDALMNSDGHSKNILNSRFEYIGIGIADKQVGGTIYVQMFMKK